MDTYMGTVLIWAPNFAPSNFAYCAGQLVAIAQNTALYSLLGVNYGGNGTQTFGLPDLRSRVAMGAGMGQPGGGLTPYPLGVISGVEHVTLNITEIPTHTHPAQGEVVVYDTPGTTQVPTSGQVLAAANTQQGPNTLPTRAYAAPAGNAVTLSPQSLSVQIGPAGNNQAHENRMPFTGLSYIICMQGIYPPRP